MKKKIINRRKKETKKRNSQKFGKVSLYIIYVSFFVSLAVISSSLMTQVGMEKYASTQVQEYNAFLKSRQARAVLNYKNMTGIIIGSGVSLPETCQVSETEVICKDV